MANGYSCSIFAYELNRVIGQYNYQLADLKNSPFTLERKKVDALIDSLRSVKRLPALNHGEIMTIVFKINIGLSEQQRNDIRLQIYAALIALGVQRLLLEYLSDERAWEVSQEVRESALMWLRRQRGKDPFRRVPSIGMAKEDMPADSSESTNPLQAALDAYDEGEALAGLAPIDDSDTLLRQARLCFERANKELEVLPLSIRATEEWTYWHQKVQEQLETMEDELG